jgi:DNA-binding winged helix-turn-helix (wHTH) protein/tetratricopeptide (TPR) repeat protein
VEIAYRFGPFELRTRDYTLTRGGEAVHVTPKAFDTLRLLVERHGELVTKQALMEALWPDAMVEEANLSVQIAALRKVLGDSDGRGRYIETVPKRGYRFIADVESSASAPETQRTVAVLPLKILRGNADSDFLAFGLPDAIAASLAERADVAVRSPLAMQRYGGAAADLAKLADAVQARFALIGTLAASGDRVTVRLQLLEFPNGTVRWSDVRTATLDDLFAVQGDVAARVCDALDRQVGTPVTVTMTDRDRPASPGAYAFYLRANQLAYEASRWFEARDLYRAAIKADPNYSPAWARLARCERLIGKFSASADETRECFSRAAEAFERAIVLNPDLSITHSLYAQLLIDLGRADEAMTRLVGQAVRRPNEADLFAGLVHALRYCGLVDASVSAHARARRLDPTVPTSVHHTWWMKGEYERALAETFGDIGYMQGLALASLGREAEASAALRWRERETTETRIRPYLVSLRAMLDGDRDASLAALDAATALPVDAEALFYLVRTYARLGEEDRATAGLGRVVDGGFWCHQTFLRDPWLEGLRRRADVRRLIDRARGRSVDAERRFAAGGGSHVI